VAVLGKLSAVVNLGDGGSSNAIPSTAVPPLEGIRAQAGGDATVSVPLDLRQLAVRTPDGWLTEDVPVTLHIGQSAADLPIELATDLRPGLGASDPA
jgi:hypothetical protein